ncbi:hypothetical protein J7E91_35085 [Streptomyces sp. ISL-99]|uniref:hypothetical protein n=1 Tax=Streptomyces sp. ISL-99 TaxID=2819193 RepID=UPI001BE8CE89|nr:hypothetical protein [Streptomyces sp. ISL-99]MBT2530430.1 hypothetical protein [Streptomyces sp. ISL-99]
MLLELAGRHPLLRDNITTRSTTHDQLILDARRLLFASPLDLAVAAATAHTHAGLAATVLLPESPDVTSYMQRMDLIAALPPDTRVVGSSPGEARSDRSETLLELALLHPDTADDISERLGRVATRHLGPRDGVRAFKGIGELLDNAISHGASPSGAFIAAQAYSGKTTGYRRLEIAICDTGVGVLEHLRRNPAHSSIATSAQALERALQPGVSGTPEQRGNGLPDLLKGTSDTAATRLVLRSGNGLLRAGRHRHASVTRSMLTAAPVRGTWSWLRVSYRS